MIRIKTSLRTVAITSHKRKGLKNLVPKDNFEHNTDLRHNVFEGRWYLYDRQSNPFIIELINKLL